MIPKKSRFPGGKKAGIPPLMNTSPISRTGALSRSGVPACTNTPARPDIPSRTGAAYIRVSTDEHRRPDGIVPRRPAADDPGRRAGGRVFHSRAVYLY